MRLVAFWVATSFWVALMRYKPGALVATLGEKCNIPKFCDCDCDCDLLHLFCIAISPCTLSAGPAFGQHFV